MADNFSPSDFLQKQLRDVVMYGYAALPNHQANRKYFAAFLKFNEQVSSFMGLELLPIELDEEGKVLRLHAEVLKPKHQKELSIHRSVFEPRLDWVALFKTSETRPMPKEDIPLANLPFMATSYDYAKRGYEHLFPNLYRHVEMLDDYGWNLAREEELGYLANSAFEECGLPYLPIKTGKNDVPEFEATPEEIDKLRELFALRNPIVEALREKLEEKTDTQVEQINGDRRLLRHEKMQKVEALEEKAARKWKKLLKPHQEKWLLENRQFNFPSEIEKPYIEDDPEPPVQNPPNEKPVWENALQDMDDTYQDHFCAAIRGVMKDGFYQIPAELWRPDYPDEFFDVNDSIMMILQIQGMPLVIDMDTDPKSGLDLMGPVIRLHPILLENAHPKDIRDYSDEVLRRLDALDEDNLDDYLVEQQCQQEEDDAAAESAEQNAEFARENDALAAFRDDDGEEDNVLDPALSFDNLMRLDNDVAADHVLGMVFGTETEPLSDPYGMCENRGRFFYEGLKRDVKKYCLPNLAVTLEQDGGFKIHASQQEIENFQFLYKSRNDQYTEASHACKKTPSQRFLVQHQREWKKDNKNYHFPSAVKNQFFDIARQFKFNSLAVEKGQGYIKIIADRNQEFQLESFRNDSPNAFVLN